MIDTNRLFPSSAPLLPPYRRDADVKLVPADADGLLFTPDWFASLVLVEIHPLTATEEGTLDALVPVLDYLAALGVNGIWLTPIYERGAGGNGYGNCGPHTLEPAIVGTADPKLGWERVAAFVSEAHRRNIRVFLDIITWGTVYAAPLYKEHPEWYRGEAWGGAAFDWQNETFRAWFTDVCVSNILKTNADGYRCDCEPVYSGYAVFAEIRARLLAAGRKIAVIAEESSERRGTYDCEQDGVTDWIDWSRGAQYQHPRAYYLEPDAKNNIVDCVKSGRLHGDPASQKNGCAGLCRYYTYCVSNHDFQNSLTECNRLVIGYQAVFAPYIPLWYLGTEIGMHAENSVIYFIPVDWTLLRNEENRAFLADVAAYLRIRRTYPDLFEVFPLHHRDVNLCKIEADTTLQAYARYAGSHAVLVIPRKDEEAERFSVSVPLQRLGLCDDVRDLYDLLTEERTAFTVEDHILHFTAEIKDRNSLAVLHLTTTAYREDGSSSVN
ncbi:MAG: alpha-amylase family glycosyl hydrolase [Eubacteriales bacterium]